MTSDDGMAVRRAVLGDEHVDRASDTASEFSGPWQEHITATACSGWLFWPRFTTSTCLRCRWGRTTATA